MLRAIGLFGAAIAISAGLGACKAGQGSGGDKAPIAKSGSFEDRAVAKLDDEVILYSDVYRAARTQGLAEPNALRQRQAASQTRTPLMPATPLDIAVFNEALDSLLDQKLLANDAARRKDYDNPLDQRRLEAAREQLLSSIRIEAHLRQTVTEEAMRALYTRQSALGAKGDELRVQHILVQNEEDANAVLERLEEGEGFDVLASELSQDKGTRDRGGNLGFVTYDMLAPDFAKPIFAKAAMRKPFSFETDKGWQVAQILARRAPEVLSYEDSRESLRRFLTFEAIDALLSDLRSNADVTFMQVTPQIQSELKTEVETQTETKPQLRKP